MATHDLFEIKIICNRTAKDNILPLLEQLKMMGSWGSTRDIEIKDWSGDKHQQSEFEFDGDGPDHIVSIETKFHKSEEEAEKELLEKDAIRVASRYPELASTLERIAGLSAREKRDLSRANVYLMDVEMDGGQLPPRIEELSNLRRRLTVEEEREILDYFYTHAPGNY